MEQVEYQSDLAQYADAFRSVRAAKNLFFVLLLLAVLVQLAAFALVQFAGVMDASKGEDPAQAIMSDSQQKTATRPADPDKFSSASLWYQVLYWALPTTKFAGIVLAALLALTLLTGVQISLVGRLGGAAGLVSALFWSLILLAMMTPWQQALQSSAACGALYNYSDLCRGARLVNQAWDPQARPSSLGLTLYYARFVAYPLLALLVLLVVQSKFARGYGRMNASAAAAGPQQRPTEPQI